MLQESLDDPSVEPPIDIDDIEQAGAICIRRSRKGALRVLLVGSKRNGRWGVPKGHIEPGETSSVAAEREAFEEAGLRGEVAVSPLGAFTYFKDSSVRRYRVLVHVMTVQSRAKLFPEKNIRRSRWFSIEEAVAKANQPGLQELLQRLT